MKDKDIWKLTDSLSGGFEDFGLDTELGKESMGKRAKRAFSVVLTGKYKGVSWPFSERAGIVAIGFAAFITLASAFALLCDALGIDNNVVWQVRIAVHSAFSGLISLLSEAATFLLNNKLVSMLFGLAVLFLLLRRK